MYADYTYYTGTYYGTQIASADWNRLATRASDFIDYYTLGRASQFVEAHPESDAVKKCCCALAEMYQNIEKARESASAAAGDSGMLQSESVGSYSRTYRNGAESYAQTDELEKAEATGIAQRYLLQTGLLYRGIGGCKCTLPTL